MLQGFKPLREGKYAEVLLHVLIWSSLLAYVWHTAYTLGPFRRQEGSIYRPLLWSAGFNVALFYVNAWCLVPWLFYKKRYKRYAFWAALLYAAVVFLNAVFDQLYSL